MLRFIFQRLLFIAVVSVAIVFFVHLGMRLVPNSERGGASGDVVANGQRAWEETRAFIGGALRGDLGARQTDFGPEPIAGILRAAYVNSLGLTAVAIVGATLFGVLIGGAAAVTRRGNLSIALLTLTVLGISVPSFFGGLLLQQAAIRYQDVYGRRLVSMAGLGWDVEHMLLPVLVLAARPLAFLTRAAFVSLSDVLRQDYIRTALAKGLTQTLILGRHALRNMAIPVLTAVGVSLRFALSTLPVVEFFFNWPGLGFNLLAAINQRETAVVAALALAMGLTFLGLNLLLDVAYRLIDPRLQAAG